MVSFKVSDVEFKLIEAITNRALALSARMGGDPGRRQDVLMDITAVHANGCRLRLSDLLAADDANFGHDIFGIRRHLNRDNGQLVNCFVPRFAAPLRG